MDDSPHHQSGMVHFSPDLCSQCAPEMRRQSIMTSQTQARDCVSIQHQLLRKPRDVAFQLLLLINHIEQHSPAKGLPCQE